MASHHHHHHQHPHQVNPFPTTTCCCSHCCTPPHHPSPPLQTDLLLQALASHILQQQQQQHQQSPPNLYSPYPNKPHNLHHHQKEQHFPEQQEHHHPHSQLILSSLLHRIDALEYSLQHLSSSTFNHFSSSSLRDTAARVIQIHFRVFLVHRSTTLRQLKHLAFIKSSFTSLKFSISNKTHFDFEAVSHKAMDLLIKLDSIQGGDSMIRDGKRSISRDLVKFLDFIDGFAVKRHQVSYKAANNVRFVGNSNKSRVLGSGCGNLGGDQREIMKKLRDRVEKIRGFSRVYENDEETVELEGFHQVIDDGEEQNPIVSINGKGGVSNIRNGVLVKRHGGQDRVKKSVSFVENGNVYRLVSSGSGDGTLIDGSDSSEDQGEVENLCNEVEGIEGGSKGSEDDEEAHLENGGSPQSSDGERNPRGCMRGEARIEDIGNYQGQNKNFVFYAPVPVKMESRADSTKKRRALKIVT